MSCTIVYINQGQEDQIEKNIDKKKGERKDGPALEDISIYPIPSVLFHPTMTTSLSFKIPLLLSPNPLKLIYTVSLLLAFPSPPPFHLSFRSIKSHNVHF